MAKTSLRRLECDFLEPRSLLSGAHASVKVHADLRAVRLGSAQAAQLAIAQAQAGLAGAVTGGGLLPTGTAPLNADTQSFQQVAYSNNAVMFIAQLEVLKGTKPGDQQAAASVLTDARNLDLLAHSVASSLGVSLPSDIEGNIRTSVQQVAILANSGSFDETALGAMNQVGTTLVGQLQQMQSGARTPASAPSRGPRYPSSRPTWPRCRPSRAAGQRPCPQSAPPRLA